LKHGLYIQEENGKLYSWGDSTLGQSANYVERPFMTESHLDLKDKQPMLKAKTLEPLLKTHSLLQFRRENTELIKA
jgi:hypothetical protein